MPILPAEIAIGKARLRLQMKSHRADLNENARALAARKVCGFLGAWLRNRAETRIAVYLALPTEIDLDALTVELINADKIVCAPRIDAGAQAATATMRFHRLLDLNAIARGAYDVREPIAEEIVRPEIVLVPGLAFDQNGGRLGMGGGWYDRALADIPVRVGVGFRGQIVDEVPREPHDVRVNWLASDAGIMECGG